MVIAVVVFGAGASVGLRRARELAWMVFWVSLAMMVATVIAIVIGV